MRTPLNAVLGYGQLLELDDLTPDQDEAVAYILAGGRHLLSLIDDVLEISRIEIDQLNVCLESVAIAELCNDVAGLIVPTAIAARITLRHDPEPLAGRGLYVQADPRRLKQVLLNLVFNAIKYNTPGGSVRIHAYASGKDGWIGLSVTDTGSGIAAADIPRLFTPFDRLGQQNTGIEGTGIGLPLTQRLVHAMGGDLEIESTPGLGSTFTVVLPAGASLDLANGTMETPNARLPG